MGEVVLPRRDNGYSLPKREHFQGEFMSYILNHGDHIGGGPSREVLFDALRLIGEKRPIHLYPVDDMGTPLGETEFFPLGIDALDNSGEYWLVRGICQNKRAKLKINTQTRIGRLRFFVKKI